MAITHINTGKEGENLASAFLNGSGYIIRESGYRSGKSEIDIIAENEEFIVFVEVKTRKDKAFGDGLSSITAKKKAMIFDGAEAYIDQNEINKAIRFDVILIDLSESEINHIIEAFSPEF